MNLAAAEPRSRHDRILRAALYLVWLALLVVLEARHAFWRDEVRAFSIALQGDTIADMLRGLHGEGHPAIWYLLLRGAHALVPVREVLPAMAIVIDAAAIALLVFRSPFRPLVLTLILFGQWVLFDFGIIARNYGIAMLVLFAVVSVYPRFRDKGIVVGLLLALLCNTNVPAVFLAAAFLLFWFIELLSEEGLRWTRKHWIWIANAGVTALGALLCFLEVFPTVHDAAVVQHPAGFGPAAVLHALAQPAGAFPQFAPWFVGWSSPVAIALTLVIFGSLFGLLRSPGGLIATLVVVAFFELFFQLVYPGSYRHQALRLAWLVAMYWLLLERRGGGWKIGEAMRTVATLGSAAFVLLLGLQVPNTMSLLVADVRGVPFSRSRDLGHFLAEKNLQNAVLIADPDTMLEPMPYYSSNPIYLLRDQKFGQFMRFTWHARLDLSLGDLLADAHKLQARTHRPVVILLQHKLDSAAPAQTRKEVFVDRFSTTPDQVRQFLAQTQHLARLEPGMTDEGYDVYLLRGFTTPAPRR